MADMGHAQLATLVRRGARYNNTTLVFVKLTCNNFYFHSQEWAFFIGLSVTEPTTDESASPKWLDPERVRDVMRLKVIYALLQPRFRVSCPLQDDSRKKSFFCSTLAYPFANVKQMQQFVVRVMEKTGFMP